MTKIELNGRMKMTNELKVIIDKETGAFRKYTVVDQVRSAFLD